MMPQSLRIFIAVPIPCELAVFLKEIKAQLQSAKLNVRWLAVENIHLTLKFLGEIEQIRVPDVVARMDAAASQVSPFSLCAKGVGVFPNRRNARVLWVGLCGELEPLGAIQTVLESGLESAGFDKESRRFRPHLTIGRTRRRMNTKTISRSLDSLKDVKSDFFPVDQLRLYKSDLKPAGAEHTLLHASHLAVK